VQTRSGLAVVPIAGLTLCALIVLTSVHAAQPRWLVVGLSLALAAAGTCEGPFWTAASALGGSRGGSAAAILNTGGNIGGMLAPVVTPAISARLGWPASLSLAGILCLGAAALWSGINPQRRAADDRSGT
jgi:MFS family permease